MGTMGLVEEEEATSLSCRQAHGHVDIVLVVAEVAVYTVRVIEMKGLSNWSPSSLTVEEFADFLNYYYCYRSPRRRRLGRIDSRRSTHI